MALSLNQLSKGSTILVGKVVYTVLDNQHVKPGKGAAFLRVKLKNVKTGAVIAKTFRGEEKIEEAFVEQKKLQYLYNTHRVYHFMDLETYEEIAINKQELESVINFLKDNLEIQTSFYEGELLTINLPPSITFKVSHTEAAIKGDTVKAGAKTATIETGLKISVPLFINEGDIVKVDTRTGKYIERVS